MYIMLEGLLNIADGEGTEVTNKNREVRWLISVSRRPVRAVVSWSCFIKTNKCPMIHCSEDETQQLLLMETGSFFHISSLQYFWS